MKKLFTLISLLGAFGMAGAQEETTTLSVLNITPNVHYNGTSVQIASAKYVANTAYHVLYAGSSTNDYDIRKAHAWAETGSGINAAPSLESTGSYTYSGNEFGFISISTAQKAVELLTQTNTKRFLTVRVSNCSAIYFNAKANGAAISVTVTDINNTENIQTYTSSTDSEWKTYKVDATLDGSKTYDIKFAGTSGSTRSYIGQICFVAANSESASKTITETGYASYVPEMEVNIPSDVTAYYLAKENVNATDGTATMTEKTGTLKTGEAVVLYKAGGGNIEFTPATEAAVKIEGNILKSAKYNVPESATVIHVFGQKNNVPGFYTYRSVPTTGIYVLDSDLSAPPGAPVRIVFGDEASNIENVTQNSCLKTQYCYNLAGQKVGADYKGIVIKNGKKYIVK